MVQAWQIIPDPQALAARGITVEQVIEAIRAANGATGGSVIEQAGADVMVRSTGYLQTREDFENVPVTTGGVPVLLGEVARVRRGPTLLRGIAELDGEGEVAVGALLLRSATNEPAAVVQVHPRFADVQASRPAGA